MSITHEWYQKEFNNQELAIEHRPLETELSFYEAVASGALDIVNENCSRNDFAYHAGKGVLSDNPIQNMKYHFAIGASIISIYCINAGMEAGKANAICQRYLQALDDINCLDSIANLHTKMCLELCHQMQILHKSRILSKPVTECLDYIHNNIEQRITVKQLSKQLNLSESYISKIFLKDMGISVSQYILDLKIEKAKNLLQYSDFNIEDIADYLSFSSQSHFISVFQKYTGSTPYKYRNKNFRSSWVPQHKV